MSWVIMLRLHLESCFPGFDTNVGCRGCGSSQNGADSERGAERVIRAVSG